MDPAVAQVVAAAITAVIGLVGLVIAAILTFISARKTREAEAEKQAAEKERDDEAAARQREAARWALIDAESQRLREREQQHIQRLTDALDRAERRAEHLQKIVDASRSGDA